MIRTTTTKGLGGQADKRLGGVFKAHSDFFPSLISSGKTFVKPLGFKESELPKKRLHSRGW